MTDVTPLEAGKAVVEAVKRRLEALTADLARLQKAENIGKSLHGLASGTPSNAQVADGDAAKTKPVLTKSVFQILGKGETFIDLKHSADPKKRDKDIGFEGVMPSDRKEKEISASACGGEVSAEPKKVKKAGADMGAKPPTSQKPPQSPSPAPQGAAAGEAPKPPKAPGAQMTVKKEVGVFARLAKKVR